MVTHTACLDALLELHARLQAMSLRSHFRAREASVVLLDHGLRFILSEQNGVRFLTVGMLVGVGHGSKCYRDYCFRSQDANVLIDRALLVVARIQDFDRQLGADALASYGQ